MTNGRLNLILYFSNRLVTFTVICWFNHFWLSCSLLIGKVRKVDLSHIANSWLVTISLRGIQNISDCWQPFSIPQRSQKIATAEPDERGERRARVWAVTADWYCGGSNFFNAYCLYYRKPLSLWSTCLITWMELLIHLQYHH